MCQSVCSCRNRILFFDNLYISPNLCDHPLQMGIRSCGICRAGCHGLLPHMAATLKQLDKGEHKAW